MKNLSRSRSATVALAAAALLSFACNARAAGPDSYAVVAMVGDELSIVGHEPVTGTSVDRNDQTHLANPDDHFDREAARVAGDAIRKAVSGAQSQSLTIPAIPAFAKGEEPSASAPSFAVLLDAVKAGLKQPDTQYLLLVSKYRGEAALRTRTGTIGSGYLTGLGFYIDTTKHMKSSRTGERGSGFIAPYAYIRVTLIDLRTGTVVRTESVKQSTTVANVGSDATLDPWNALDADQKVRLLDNILRRAVLETVPKVVAPA